MSAQFGKLLIGFGLMIAVAGVLVLVLSKLPWLRLGRLPGDINIQRNGFSLYIPLMTMFLISALLSLAMFLAARFKR